MQQRIITIDMLRHGETDGGNIYRGSTDSPLTPNGLRQMKNSVAEFDSKHLWQKVYCSPLQRCRVFAESCAASNQLPFKVEDQLREIDFGDWDGCDITEVWRQTPQLVEAFWQDPESNPPPGGESIQQLMQRTKLFIDQILAAEEDHLLLVSHGGVIRALLAQILNIPASSWAALRVDYASFSRIQLGVEPESNWSSVCFVNRCSALL